MEQNNFLYNVNRSKHMKVDYHFIRHYLEHVDNDDLVVRFVPIQLQLADIFTKGFCS